MREGNVDTPRYEPCEHLKKKGKGCGIYDDRPMQCSAYSCYWLEGFGANRDRPDRLGIMLDSSAGIIEGIYKLSGIKCVAANEVRPGALRDPRVKQFIAQIMGKGLGILWQDREHKGPPIFALPGVLEKIEAAASKLEGWARLIDEHYEQGHPEPVEDCGGCKQQCPCHESFQPICPVCRRILQEAVPAAG